MDVKNAGSGVYEHQAHTVEIHVRVIRLQHINVKVEKVLEDGSYDAKLVND